MLLTFPFYSIIASSAGFATTFWTLGVLVIAALPVVYFWDR